jgi:phospholipid transport system substrate-binding protein
MTSFRGFYSSAFSGVFSSVSMVALLVLAFAAPVQAQMENPDSVVRSAAEAVLESMEGRREYLESHPDELRQLVNDIFLPRFDRSYAAYLVLARHGRAATADQRSRFTEALYQYILNRYARGLLSFTSDRLQILPFEGEEGQERATVRTFVVLNDGSRIPVNYDLRLADSGWRVYDIAIDGISYLRNLRSQLGEEIERNGLDSVITRLIADGDDAEDNPA